MHPKLEDILMTMGKKEVLPLVESRPWLLKDAIKLSLTNKQPYAWRAASLTWSCMEKNDPRVQPHLDSLLEALPQKQENHQRELLKILLHMELDNIQEGFLFDFCVGLWEKIGLKPSIRFTAFRFIMKMSEKYPDLAPEVQLHLQDHYLEPLSAAARKAVLKMAKMPREENRGRAK
jgi:hypothetical protein